MTTYDRDLLIDALAWRNLRQSVSGLEAMGVLTGNLSPLLDRMEAAAAHVVDELAESAPELPEEEERRP